MGKERPEDTGAEREVRARVRESRGQKRVPEDDGRTDLDEAGLEMARNAAEAGLALARTTIRVDAVSNKSAPPEPAPTYAAPPTYSHAPQPAQMTYAAHQPTRVTYAAQMTYAAPQTPQMTYAAPRWCDIADENWRSDPF